MPLAKLPEAVIDRPSWTLMVLFCHLRTTFASWQNWHGSWQSRSGMLLRYLPPAQQIARRTPAKQILSPQDIGHRWTWYTVPHHQGKPSMTEQTCDFTDDRTPGEPTTGLPSPPAAAEILESLRR